MMLKKHIQFSNVFKFVGNSKLFSTKKPEKKSSDVDEVVFDLFGDKGIITLNRPKALNSLNLSMVEKLLHTLVKWESSKKFVVVKGAGGKSFCSGADVKTIALANKKKDKYGYKFFKTEYAMNGVIGTYQIPYIAIIDGIVMGGGCGMSVHGQYRIATERTLFAMPETQIALFPDVGMSYVFSRMQGNMGLYLALTGHRLKGYDTVLAGIATHYVNSKDIPTLHKCLLQCNRESEINQLLKKCGECKTTKFSLEPYMEKIHCCFSGDSVECILENLKNDNSKWARSTLEVLCQMSPTSLKVTKEIISRANTKRSLEECLRMEYNVACNTLDNNEFNEGVRALLIDKDKKPNWDPSCLEGVTDEIVESHFCPAKDELSGDFRKL